VKTGIDNFDQLKEVLCFFQFFSAYSQDLRFFTPCFINIFQSKVNIANGKIRKK